jgi:predicted nucleic acid-binding protein
MNASGADRYFVDSNVILYSLDSREPSLQVQARAWLQHLWTHASGQLSWQVLHEVSANAIRKFGVPILEVRRTIEAFTRWEPQDTSLSILELAWDWMEQAQLSYWDSLILAAAQRSGCRWLLSEDFQHERQYGPVTVLNPFRVVPGKMM